jgi:Cu/Ag efflux protein CusF
MMCFTKWVSALAAIVLLAGTALAAEAVTYGKVKAINDAKKEVVLTDSDGKDWTFKLAEDVVINRAGKESQTDLKTGDPVNVLFDKGVVTWTAHYFLVTDGDRKNWELMCGTVKSYDPDKKELSITDEHGKAWAFPVGDAKVRLNREDSKIQDIKIGDHTSVIVEKMGDKATLKSLMVERK